MSGHTKGKWKWEFSGTMGRWVLVNEAGESIKIAGPPDSELTEDMLVMAAAPDLLEACKRLLHEFDPEYGDGCDLHYKETVAEVNAEILQQARAAISAATPSEARQ